MIDAVIGCDRLGITQVVTHCVNCIICKPCGSKLEVMNDSRILSGDRTQKTT